MSGPAFVAIDNVKLWVTFINTSRSSNLKFLVIVSCSKSFQHTEMNFCLVESSVGICGQTQDEKGLETQ